MKGFAMNSRLLCLRISFIYLFILKSLADLMNILNQYYLEYLK